MAFKCLWRHRKHLGDSYWVATRIWYFISKGSLVGESERKIRQTTATIDAFGSAV